MALIGYGRVSTRDQDPDVQRDLLTVAGVGEANRGRSALPPELHSESVAARPGAVDEELDDNVTDMRSTLVAGFEEHLRSLSECGRCVSDEDEKCVDRWLIGEDRFSIDDIECGCGCWTRTAYRVQLGLEDDLPS